MCDGHLFLCLFFSPLVKKDYSPPPHTTPLGYDDDVDDYCAASQEKPR